MHCNVHCIVRPGLGLVCCMWCFYSCQPAGLARGAALPEQGTFVCCAFAVMPWDVCGGGSRHMC